MPGTPDFTDIITYTIPSNPVILACMNMDTSTPTHHGTVDQSIHDQLKCYPFCRNPLLPAIKDTTYINLTPPHIQETAPLIELNSDQKIELQTLYETYKQKFKDSEFETANTLLRRVLKFNFLETNERLFCQLEMLARLELFESAKAKIADYLAAIDNNTDDKFYQATLEVQK